MDYAKPKRLCVGAMAHIISKRKVALIQKRYIYGDKVLGGVG